MRKIFDFHGGIHPPENKHQSLIEGIRSAGIPDLLIIPLSQHVGAPSSPIVSIGEQVLGGQMIAEAQGLVSVPLHAPTSGRVIAIEERAIPHPSGFRALCIVIEPDGADDWVEQEGVADYQRETPQHLLEIIRNAGIAGMGGAGFPAAVKLASDKPIETLIINGTE